MLRDDSWDSLQNRELLGTSMGRWCCLPLALRLWFSEAQLSCKTQKSKIFLQSIFRGSCKSLQANCAIMCVRVRLLGLAQADLSAGPLLWPSPASYTFASSTGSLDKHMLSFQITPHSRPTMGRIRAFKWSPDSSTVTAVTGHICTDCYWPLAVEARGGIRHPWMFIRLNVPDKT